MFRQLLGQWLFSLPEIRMSEDVDHDLCQFMGIVLNPDDDTSVDTGLGNDSDDSTLDD
jgi:hypothetical protein